MSQALLNSLTDAERRMVAETDRDALSTLDEDELLELHQRIRRARTKYVKNYRRGASTSVATAGGRGLAFPRNQRDRDKAELFERALAKVSREVATAARRAAAELRSERIAAAQTTKTTKTAQKAKPGPTSPRRSVTSVRAAVDGPARATKTTGGLKKDASTRAAGARRQAKRDQK
jgi:hypothetical protein